jgi:hypothetical protein
VLDRYFWPVGMSCLREKFGDVVEDA